MYVAGTGSASKGCVGMNPGSGRYRGISGWIDMTSGALPTSPTRKVTVILCSISLGTLICFIQVLNPIAATLTTQGHCEKISSAWPWLSVWTGFDGIARSDCTVIVALGT